MFRNNIANDGKGGGIYTINNDVYLSKVIFDNNQAYTSTSYSDGDGGQSMSPIIIAISRIRQVSQ